MSYYLTVRNYKLINAGIIASYTAILVALAVSFLVSDQSLLYRMHYDLPLMFMVRFSAFWFLSFVLALSIFMYHLNANYINIPVSDKLYALRLGKLALWLGLLGGVLAVTFYFLVPKLY